MISRNRLGGHAKLKNCHGNVRKMMSGSRETLYPDASFSFASAEMSRGEALYISFAGLHFFGKLLLTKEMLMQFNWKGGNALHTKLLCRKREID